MHSCLLAASFAVVVLGACREPTTPQVNEAPGHFSSIAAGRFHACAIDDQNRAWCWGDNSEGQSGYQVGIWFPGRLALVGGGHAFASISAGYSHTCGLTVEGDAFCWGYDRWGELGGATRAPVQCDGFPCTGEAVKVAVDHELKRIIAGDYATCAITVLDVGHCWGAEPAMPANGASKVLIDPSTGDSTWRAIAGAYAFSYDCGITGPGALACWGDDWFGQLGTGGVSPSGARPRLPLRAIGTALSFACALDAGGFAFCWGTGGGALDPGEIADTCIVSGNSRPCYKSPRPVAGGFAFSSLTVGTQHACGLLASGEARCWGSNTQYELGNTSLGTTPPPMPMPAAAGLRFIELAAGEGYTCGLTTQHNIYCWGAVHSALSVAEVDGAVPILITVP
jgi:Regulator of chromosome condensation (RCC1) repeat